MPMIWSAEADAKLMAHILQACDVKLSGAQMKEIATLMGSECTPKAIAHRMTYFRKMAVNGATKAGDAPKGRAGGKGRKGRKGGEGKVGETSPEAGEQDDEAEPGEHSGIAAKAVKAKRGREDEEEDDADDAVHEEKKIKMEAGEENGDIDCD